MPRLLLCNFDEKSADLLKSFLRNEHYEVHACLETKSFFQIYKFVPQPIDVVILDVSRNEKYVRSLLNEIAAFRALEGPRPMLLCISRAYRGPQFELELERKGARLIYV